jgi:hypothetical protein
VGGVRYRGCLRGLRPRDGRGRVDGHPLRPGLRVTRPPPGAEPSTRVRPVDRIDRAGSRRPTRSGQNYISGEFRYVFFNYSRDSGAHGPKP